MNSTGRVRMHRQRAEMPCERIESVCDCGHTIRVTIEHYQRVKCGQCGLIWWALQPKRFGGLVLYRWPGLTPPDDNETVTFDNSTF